MSNFTPVTNTSGSVVYSVEDGGLNNQTSLTLIGRNSTGYTQIIGENFLHLLESFASFEKNSNLDTTSGPKSPIKGQLWYNLTGNSGLKVFNGTNWVSLSVVKKSSINPLLDTKNSAPNRPEDGLSIGDFYVDIANQQLYIYTGKGKKWALVGPPSNPNSKTAAEANVLINAADNTDKPVLILYANENKMAIVSDIEFTPKSSDPDYPIIKKGITLNSNKANAVKFWGISEKAESLIVGDTIVSSENFLRSDQESVTRYAFKIRNDGGLLIGTNYSMSIGVDNGAGIIYNKNINSKIKFDILKATGEKTILTIDSGNVNKDTGYIGINKTNPEYSLDVTGGIRTNDSLIITGENDSDIANPNVPSIFSKGGMVIEKSVSIGKKLYVEGTSNLKDVLPKVGNLYSLGAPPTSNTPGFKWANIWTNQIGDVTNPAEIYGTLNGNITGNAITANSLNTAIDIEFSGDIVGSTDLNSLRKNTISVTVNQDFIRTRPQITTFVDGDEILVSRQTPSNLRVLSRINRFDLFKTLPVVPIGTILLWANIQIPIGYRICDGSILIKSEYSQLCRALSATEFVDAASITKFRLPDLRNNVPDPELDATSTAIYTFNYIVFTGRFI
jgi:hypothetical protein